MNGERIRANLKSIQGRIAAAGHGRDITLVGVSKTHTIEEMRCLWEAGLRDFGESRVQEYQAKAGELEGARWHLIGSLQRNKVKGVAGKVHLIHSVDTVPLLEEISKRSLLAGARQGVLLQVNYAHESQKHGFEVGELPGALEVARRLEGIAVKGLMFIAPDSDDTARLAQLFEGMRILYDNLLQSSPKCDNIVLDVLSMGMSNDFEEAIRAGANTVRIGHALFA